MILGIGLFYIDKYVQLKYKRLRFSKEKTEEFWVEFVDSVIKDVVILVNYDERTQFLFLQGNLPTLLPDQEIVTSMPSCWRSTRVTTSSSSSLRAS